VTAGLEPRAWSKALALRVERHLLKRCNDERCRRPADQQGTIFCAASAIQWCEWGPADGKEAFLVAGDSDSLAASPPMPAETSMGTEPRAARKATRRRKPPEEIVDYIVEIESWDFSYWLALNTLRDPLDPYHEHRGLQIKGRLLQPTGLKTDRAEVSLFPSSNLQEERRKDLKPIAVGGLESYAEKIDGHVGIPADMLGPILQMLIASRFKFIVMRGSTFRYRSARLISYRLDTKLEEDDLESMEAT
jgi:hypothetical protein